MTAKLEKVMFSREGFQSIEFVKDLEYLANKLMYADDFMLQYYEGDISLEDQAPKIIRIAALSTGLCLPRAYKAIHRQLHTSGDLKLLNIESRHNQIAIFEYDLACGVIEHIQSNYYKNRSSTVEFILDKPAYWISLFSIYPSYGMLTTNYVENANGALTFVSSDEKGHVISNISENVKIRSQTSIPEIYEQDIRATCHLIILNLLKTYSADVRDTQLAQVVERRLNTLKNILLTNTLNVLVDNEFLANMSGFVQHHVKLRELLWMFCKYEKSNFPEMASAYSLTEFAGMANIHSVLEFFAGRKRVLAHRCKELIPEMVKLNEMKKAVERKISKDDFPYMRILLPEDQSIQSSQFPNLFPVAQAYCAKNVSETFRNIKVKTSLMNPKMLYLAVQVDNNSFNYELRESDVETFNDPVITKNFFKDVLGYDYDKINIQEDIKLIRTDKGFRGC